MLPPTIKTFLGPKGFSPRRVMLMLGLLFLAILLHTGYFFFTVDKKYTPPPIKNMHESTHNLRDKKYFLEKPDFFYQASVQMTHDFHAAVESHLFGEVIPDPRQFPLSRLPIMLTGILYSSVEKQSQISIRLTDLQDLGHASAKEKFYHQEDALLKNVFIKKIFPRYAVIQNQGLYERLVIYHKAYKKNETD